MPSYNNQSQFLSRPMELFWAGWRTTTVDLQRAGWELSAQQSYDDFIMRLALRHTQLGVVGLTRGIDYAQAHQASRQPWPIDGGNVIHDQVDLAHRLEIRSAETNFNPSAFEPIDATPRYIEEEVYNLGDLKIFKTVNRDAEEIYLSKASMADILDVALSKQEGKQAEIRQRMLRDKDMRPNSNVKAELRLVI